MTGSRATIFFQSCFKRQSVVRHCRLCLCLGPCHPCADLFPQWLQVVPAWGSTLPVLESWRLTLKPWRPSWSHGGSTWSLGVSPDSVISSDKKLDRKIYPGHWCSQRWRNNARQTSPVIARWLFNALILFIFCITSLEEIFTKFWVILQQKYVWRSLAVASMKPLA